MKLAWKFTFSLRLNEDFHIKCERIGIIFSENPVEDQLLSSLYEEEKKRRKKNNEVFY